MFTPLLFDKPRNLRFDIPACLALESVLGVPFGVVVNRLHQCSITSTCGALWAGLKHEDPNLKMEDLPQMLQTYLDNGGELMVLNDALNKAISESTPLKSVKVPGSVEGNVKPEPAVIG